MKIKSIVPLLLIATVSFVLFLTSCQQDPDNTPPPPTNDSTYISMVVAVDSTVPSGSDTLLKSVYTYDAQKRISMIQQFEYDNNGIRKMYWTQQVRYYHGNDTLPYMLVSFFDDFPGTDDTDSTYLFYNSNNVIVQDSQVYINNFGGTKTIFITDYTQLSATRYKIRREMRVDDPAGIYVDSIMGTQIVQNGNVTSKHDSVWSSSYPGDVAVYTTQLTYDNKPNAMFRTLLPYMWGLESSYGNDAELTETYYTSVNNATSISYTSEHPYDGNYSYSVNNISYDYRTDGYPKVKRYNHYADNAKTFYIYKRL